MRIVIDMQGAQSESRFRGIGRYTLSLAKAIVRNQGEHEIILALSGLFPDTIEPIRAAFDGLLPQENIRVWHAPGPARECKPSNKWRREAAELIREAFLDSLRPDVVHVSSLFEGYIDDAVTSIGVFAPRIPTVVTLYDLIPLLNPEIYLKPNPGYAQFYQRKIEHLKRANQWLAISASAAGEGQDALSFPVDAVVNISTACDPVFRRIEIPETENQQLRVRFGITKPFVLYSGGADSRKNLHRLIRAYACLPKPLREAHQLVMAGKMPEGDTAELRKTAKSVGISEGSLLFTGYVSDEDLARFYNLCTVFVFPSRHEGFGLPALEAMSCGAAVIGSNISSIPEVIGLSKAMFDPHDEKAISQKLAEVLGNEAFRDELSAHGLEQAKKFSWDESARRAIAAFEKLHSGGAAALEEDESDNLLPQLIQAIATVAPPNIPDVELLNIAHSLSHIRTGDSPKQLLVDISELAQRDARTGIQRVERGILKELLARPPEGYVVEPVYATPETPGYRYARGFIARFRGVSSDLDDDPIEYGPGDIFLGLDLHHRTVIVQRDFLMGLRQGGVKINFVVYDLLPILMPHAFVLETDIHKIWLETITAFDGAVCISRAVADELMDWLEVNGQQRIRPFNINWFHLGADIENSVPTFGLPADAEAVLDRIARVPSFLMVGTVEPRKCHQQTLAAFERLWARGVDISLVIIGKQGWAVGELVERLRHHRELGKRLFWLKDVSDEYLEKVYAASTCLVAASEGEGFGLPLIEAARHKLPIIARGIPAFREIAGEHAFYFDGLQPDSLALAIEEWLAIAAAGRTPQSSGIQWLTWVESAEQLKRRVFGHDWYKQWLPQKEERRVTTSPTASQAAVVIKPYYPLRDEWYDAQHPDVSLIVLNYNKPAMTLACLDSLWAHTQGYRYEIVLVDNGSETKNFQDLAPAQAGARIVRLEVNRFFGEGSNIGFEAARGRYVVFLNNDITATAGWLAPLIQRLADDPGIGAAGPKLVSPDYRLQEAGAEIRADGSDNRYGRGGDPDDPAYATQRDVMYVSAAALAMRRETFEQVLGFDLYYEPAYYEDCDLCLKIRQINLRVTYCPDSCIVHHENATSGDYASLLKLNTLIPLNRERFLARWRPVLAGEASAVPGLIPPLAQPLQHREGLPSVLLYTPFNLIPGGGERYLLTIAAGLAEVANVTLATQHPFSRLRLRTLGRELSLNLDAVRITTLDQATNSATYDASIVMGNEALPGIPGKGKHNIYLCQFPFPAPQEVLNDRRKYADDYEQVVVYSPFVQRHYARALQALGRPLPKITVVSPPAVLASSTQNSTKKAMILGVGRFFTGGHAKRQDLMIEAFRQLAALRPEAELHLAGSLPAEGEFRAYFADLQHKAEGLQVYFHPNASPQLLAQLYADASLYWHLTGYGADEATEPHRCEHFGITVVEAMSAGCIPLVVNRGGPPETVRDDVSGYVFETLDELVEISARILSLPAGDAGIAAMRAAAIATSSRYSPEHFIAEFRDLMPSDGIFQRIRRYLFARWKSSR